MLHCAKCQCKQPIRYTATHARQVRLVIFLYLCSFFFVLLEPAPAIELCRFFYAKPIKVPMFGILVTSPSYQVHFQLVFCLAVYLSFLERSQMQKFHSTSEHCFNINKHIQSRECLNVPLACVNTTLLSGVKNG